MRTLDRLAAMKGKFGREAAQRTAGLLEELRGMRLRPPADLIRLHETALFLRAYPQSARVMRLADQILFSFAKRLPADREPFADPDISGIAGTAVATNFSYEFARSLSARHGRSVSIDWDSFEHVERLAPALRRLIPVSRDDWAVEAHPDWRGWFEKGRGDLQALMEYLTPEIYDLLEIPLRWDPGTASRSHLRLARRKIFYHDGPFQKREPGLIAKMLAAPPVPRKVLPAAQARKIAGVIVDASAVRYRELYGFLYPDLARMEHVDLGRGTDFFLFAPAPQHRLPVRDYLCGMFFKNGVPTGYIEGLASVCGILGSDRSRRSRLQTNVDSTRPEMEPRLTGAVKAPLFTRTLTRDANMEVGFNLYYTFRDGETAWLYAMLLKVLRERSGVQTFSVDPYQIGHENEEAIESGAFWFYRKLGFAPESPKATRLLAREERKITAHPGYRTAPATLRKLAVSRLVYRV
jgi:hypothetical protein